LPDHPAAGQIAAQLEAQGAKSLRHSSGRSWIVGWWSDEELVVATAGDKRVAVLGCTTVDSDALERKLAGIRTNADLSRLAGDLSGCFHLVSSLAGKVRAQGNLAGVYRIYHSRIDGVTVAADRPDWLVRWTGASLDERLLPVWLLLPYGPPWPVIYRPLWHGVHAVLPGHCLDLDDSGTPRTSRWWSIPEPELSRSEGAERVLAALEDAIRARAGSAGSVPLSFDLSGGMDSTSLCYLADRQRIPLTTINYVAADPTNPDSRWAGRARRDLSGARHVVSPSQSLPGYYTEPTRQASDVGLEGPTNLVFRSMVEHNVKLVADAGARRHLQGHGSDCLFTPDLALLSSVVRRHPWRWLRSMQARKARGRYTLAAVLRQFRSPGSHRRWLLREASRLTAGGEIRQDGGWELSLRTPEWATPQAVDQIRAVLVSAAKSDLEPLASAPPEHALLRGVQVCGQVIRQSSVIGESAQVSFEGPFLDDRVIEATLSIRVRERFQARVNKPVLAAAMRGVVPDDILDRRDKSNGAREMFDGVRRSRPQLEEVLSDPLLARRGLVEADTLRNVVLSLQSNLERLSQLDPTWSCEMWLRALEADHPMSHQPVLVGR
jgi:asparagine synthase (glutamine-hydrolysing)